ncbi:hypothetical protein pqer_cds_609 [Pandoravirus quercus]|nr:hypothetical protein pqer_cds_609 [Pandoravirus quercus]AVK75031.1 hypothetical protein pqer_cds_609 [Pandoravirus quercus]
MDHRKHDEAVLREFVGPHLYKGGPMVRINDQDKPFTGWESLVDRFVEATKCICHDCYIKVGAGDRTCIPKGRLYYYGEVNDALPRMAAVIRLEDATAVRTISDWCRALAQTLGVCRSMMFDVDSREETRIRHVGEALNMLAKVGEAAAAFFAGQVGPVAPVAPTRPTTGEGAWPLPLVRACMARDRVRLESATCSKVGPNAWWILASGCSVLMDDGSAEDFILEESIGCGHPVPGVSDPVCGWIAQATDAFVINGPYLLDVEETARTLHAVCHD